MLLAIVTDYQIDFNNSIIMDSSNSNTDHTSNINTNNINTSNVISIPLEHHQQHHEDYIIGDNPIIEQINKINNAIDNNDLLLAERLCKHTIILNENNNNMKIKIQVLTIYKILIKLLILKNELNEASKYAEMCLCLTVEIMGGYHVDTANAMTLVASILKKGNIDQQENAEQIYNQAIDIYKTLYGNNANELIASAIMNMAMSIEAQGDTRLHDAIQYYTDALQMRRKLYGENHPETGDSLLCLASCLTRYGNEAEAAARYEQAYYVYKSLLNTNIEQGEYSRLDLCKRSLSTLLKKKSLNCSKDGNLAEASVISLASEIGVIGDTIAIGHFYTSSDNVLNLGKVKKSMFAALFPIDKNNLTKILIWAYVDDNNSIVNYLANRSSLGLLLGRRSNLPSCETIEIDSNKTELKIEVDKSGNKNDIHLVINSIDDNRVLFDAWCPQENRSEINDWEDLFTS